MKKLLIALGLALLLIPTSASALFCPDLTQNMRQGYCDQNLDDTDCAAHVTGDQVTQLQKFLKEYYPTKPANCSGPILVTGYFGGRTKCYVQNFQREWDLPTTGNVFGLTRAAIAQACQQAATSPAPTPPPTPPINWEPIGASCVNPWGTRVENLGSVTAYESSMVDFGMFCKSETRVCINGTLTGSYQNAHCTGGGNVVISCYFNGRIVENGGSVTAYQNTWQPTFPPQNRCVSETRVCHNGVLSGSYTDTTCGSTDWLPEGAYSWRAGEWGGCVNGTQTRSVQCVSHDGLVVVDSSCTGAKPATSQSCTTGGVDGHTGLPSVTITSPSAGTTVAGTVAINANASDSGGVTKVEFYVDGNLKGNDTVTPYSYNWDTTNGGTHACSGAHTHTLTAKAYDAAGNVTTSSGVVVYMNNPPHCGVTTSYSWHISEWGQCTNGTQVRIVWCINSAQQVVADSYCTGTKPATSQSCGTVSTPSITITAPPSGAIIQTNSTLEISWQSANAPTGAKVNISLPAVNGDAGIVGCQNLSTTGSCSWTVPANINGNINLQAKLVSSTGSVLAQTSVPITFTSSTAGTSNPTLVSFSVDQGKYYYGGDFMYTVSAVFSAPFNSGNLYVAFAPDYTVDWGDGVVRGIYTYKCTASSPESCYRTYSHSRSIYYVHNDGYKKLVPGDYTLRLLKSGVEVARTSLHVPGIGGDVSAANNSSQLASALTALQVALSAIQSLLTR